MSPDAPGTSTEVKRQAGSSAVWRILGWVALAAPAIVALVWISTMGIAIPEPSDVLVYRGDPALEFRWERVFSTGNDPAFLFQRAAYLGLLSIPGSDFGVIRFLPWMLAVLCCVVFARLLRTLAGDKANPRLVFGGVLLFVFWAFSPAFGANWLVGARMRMFLPPLFFLLAMGLLVRGTGWRWRFLASLLLAQLAIFTEKSGMLVWIALAPVVYTEASRRGRRGPWGSFAWWVLLGNIGTLLCYVAMRGEMSTQPGLVGRLQDDPIALLEYAVVNFGRFIPEAVDHAYTPWVNASALGSAFIVLGLMTFGRRRDAERMRAAMPWFGFCVFAIGLVVLLTEWHSGSILTPGFLREFMWPGCFVVVGVAGLLKVHAAALAKVVLPVAALALFVMTSLDWLRGFEHLKVAHSSCRTVEAVTAMHDAGVEMPVVPLPAVSYTTAKWLRARGLLSGLPALASNDLDEFDVQGTDAGARKGRMLAFSAKDASGEVLAYRFEPAPPLILLTRHEPGAKEVVFKIAAPNFYRGGARFPWLASFPTMRFEAGEEVRAYALYLEGLKAYPLPGRFRFGDGRFQPVEGVK
jgi:hypothetical protein